MEYIIVVLLVAAVVLLVTGKPLRIVIKHEYDYRKDEPPVALSVEEETVKAVKIVNEQNSELNNVLKELNAFMTGGSSNEQSNRDA